MTNSSKAHDLIKHEAPSANVSDVAHEHMPSMPFDPSMTAVAQGHVEGAWSITALGDDWTPGKVFVLPEGSTMKVEHGTAIRVQSADGWHHCEFPQSGALHGPVVWTKAEAANEQELLKRVPGRDVVDVAFLAGVMFTTALGIVAAKAHIGVIASWTIWIQISFMLTTTLVWVAAAILGGVVAASLVGRLANWLLPRSITKINRRVSKTLRMPRSAFLALGAPQPHLKLVAPELPMDDLDRDICAHLESYRAQRAQLSARKVASGPMVEHAATMIDEIETRLKAGTSALREEGLRQSYLALIQRAEADVVKLLHKKETEEAEGVVKDVSALIRQMDLHER
jgi:hypothetical protein